MQIFIFTIFLVVSQKEDCGNKNLLIFHLLFGMDGWQGLILEVKFDDDPLIQYIKSSRRK